MIASYQAGPVIYKRLMEENGVKSIAFVARNEADPLNQRSEGVDAANMLGLEVLASEDTYEPGTTDFFPVMSRIVQLDPDLIVLSGVAPSDAPQLIKTARELGYGGLLSTETAQDAKILSEVAGDAANGFISVGGASTPEISDDYMNAFREAYVAHVGEWNDEAGTKVYALEMIIETLKLAGAAAIDDIEVFKAAMPNLDGREPAPQGRELAHLRRQRILPAAPAVADPDGGERVPRRRVPDPLRGLGRVAGRQRRKLGPR